MEHIAVLKERYEKFQATMTAENDRKALVARLLVEADLNKRLALLIMDEESNFDLSEYELK